MADDRPGRLGEAQSLGLQGYYDAAFKVLEELLAEAPACVAGLRMKGNLLELKAFEVMEHSPKKLTSSADFLAARRCYEEILAIDPGYVKAYIDLGDHYGNLDANDKSLEYYWRAMRVLQQTPKGETWKEDVEELLKAVGLLKKHNRLVTEARSLEAWCKQALDTTD